MNFVRPCLFMLPMILLMLSKKWKTVARFLVTYTMLFALEITVLPMLKGTWNFILGGAIGIYTHMLPGFVMGYYLIDSTTVSEFVAAMKRMGVSEKIVIPMSLSGGQKQRVAIASAIVSGREMIVFDEPTSGLDFKHMKEVAQELQLLRKMGKTVLVITHDYELIASCCTHVLHLEKGTVADQYPFDETGAKKMKDFFIE